MIPGHPLSEMPGVALLLLFVFILETALAAYAWDLYEQ